LQAWGYGVSLGDKNAQGKSIGLGQESDSLFLEFRSAP
jgi:hypothetical protein